VPSYLVETYVPRARAAELPAAAVRAEEAAALVAADGLFVRFLRSTFVPTDELCFLTFEADSAAVVAEVTKRAAIDFERIVEAVE
jgi:hypothetical protein